MEPQKLDSLHGVKSNESKDLKSANEKIAYYRNHFGRLPGEQRASDDNSILASFDRKRLEAAQYLADYLAGQEDGGGRTFDEVFRDARDFEDLARQTALIGQLMAELNDLAGTDRDFTGRREALSMLGDLSLRLKKTGRIAAARPGRLTTW